MLMGAGASGRLPGEAARLGGSALLVTGSGSLGRSGGLDGIVRGLEGAGLRVTVRSVAGEPSPETVDGMAEGLRGEVDLVVAAGGGSVLDAGKAVSAMLVREGPVAGYLERVGTRPFPGGRCPLVALPTTAGTGSEATRNAVLSRVGPEGFKASLRHDDLVPDLAVVDPDLALSCPPHVTAACGMDALTQLLGSLVSTGGSPFTEALALSGLRRLGSGLTRAFRDGDDPEARGDMAYAALLSGITLTDAGLGVVHGFASSVGARFPIPHGVLCGTLLAACTRANVEGLLAAGATGRPFLRLYAAAGELFSGEATGDVEGSCALLLELLERWTEELGMPRLGDYGVGEEDLPGLASATGLKRNPVELTDDRLEEILRSRL